MRGRWVNLTVLIGFLLTAPAGVFLYFTSQSMGYPASTAGMVAGALALAGLALLPAALRGKTLESPAGDTLPAKAAWGVLIGFLVVLATAAA
jgi:hypothetical protein